MSRSLLGMALFCALSVAAGDVPKAEGEEKLTYLVNWPSGLSLGEARFVAQEMALPEAPGWRQRRLEMTIEANLPGFAVLDKYASKATEDYCSLELTKEFVHGKRTGAETTVVNPGQLTAKRTTKNGGTSEIKISACAKDALSYLYFLRNELKAGRLPPPQGVLFGAVYQISLAFVRRHKLLVNNEYVDADQIDVTYKGPASQKKFTIYFARDAARTPLLIQVPFELGTFSLELVR